IVRIQITDLTNRLLRQGIGLKVAETAIEFIASEGYDSVFGARPMKRFIQREVETPIARKVIAGELKEGSVVTVEIADGKLVLT
ncbi:MAG: ATP-dependent Clp protease ATP-binding subunit, partial [Lentisphaerae bacterium]|nr:ATP-dependent Clp protease ATP-binding subunit [Lentisphaerota bacterium]